MNKKDSIRKIRHTLITLDGLRVELHSLDEWIIYSSL